MEVGSLRSFSWLKTSKVKNSTIERALPKHKVIVGEICEGL